MSNTISLSFSFFASMLKLSKQGQRRVSNFLEKLHTDPARPGLNIEKLHMSKGRDEVYSLRVDDGLRVLATKLGSGYVLLQVCTHDNAYRDPSSSIGPPIATLVDVPESLGGIRQIPKSHAITDAPKLFAAFTDLQLKATGLDPKQLEMVRTWCTEDELAASIYAPDPISHLSDEVADGLDRLLHGRPTAKPLDKALSAALTPTWTPSNWDELSNALAEPFAAWRRFLPKEFRAIVEADPEQPLLVRGPAGSGKTVVAMYRAQHLLSRGLKVLVVTFNRSLKNYISAALSGICSDSELRNLNVSTVHSMALQYSNLAGLRLRPLDGDGEVSIPPTVAGELFRVSPKLTTAFAADELKRVVVARGLVDPTEYYLCSRAGRGLALPLIHRKALWDNCFGDVVKQIQDSRQRPWPYIVRAVRDELDRGAIKHEFDAVIVDEVQDLDEQELRFVSALAQRGKSHRLTLIGDAVQRIFVAGSCLQSLGIATTGRTRQLNTVYRNSLAIERVLRRLREKLEPGASKEIVSGSPNEGECVLRGLPTMESETSFVVKRVKELIASGLPGSAIAVLARRNFVAASFRYALNSAKVSTCMLEDSSFPQSVRVGTMSSCKGLEFAAVFVVACRKNELPLRQAKVRIPADESDAFDQQEKNLLYVAMGRARDHLFVTWWGEPSPFIRLLEAD